MITSIQNLYFFFFFFVLKTETIAIKKDGNRGEDLRQHEPKKSRENNSFSNEFFPHLEYLLFDQVSQVEQILKKFHEFHSKVAQNPNYSPVITNEANYELVQDLMLNFNNFGPNLGDQFDLTFDMLFAWPTGKFLV